MPTRRFVLLFATLLLWGATFAATAQQAPAESRISGRFVLIDHDGRTVSDEAWRGKIRLVTFGYTSCPDVCPTTLSALSAALDRLGPERDKAAVLFVSVDPDRDTTSHLKAYLSAFPGVTGLTGTPEMVAAATRNFRVRYEKRVLKDAAPGFYGVDHSGGTFVMDRDGGFLARLSHTLTAAEVADAVRPHLRAP